MSSPLLIVTGDFGQNGGMDWSNREVARYFAEHGHPVHLVGFTCDPELQKTKNIHFHRVAKPLNSYFLGFFLLNRVGKHWAKKITADSGRVIVNGGNCDWTDVNWVHYLHNRAEASGMLRLLKLRLFQAQEKKIIRQSKVVITTAEANRRDLKALFGIDSHVIPLGIARENFSPVDPAEKRKLRAEWKLANKEIVFTFIGSFDGDRKGFDILYQVWKELKWNHRLLVAGNGPSLAKWKALAITDGLTSIQFLDFCQDIPKLLKISDAVVVPSRYEPYSLVAQEAIASDIPCFLSERCGFSERVPSSLKPAFVLNPEHPHEWLQAFKNFAADPFLYQQKIKSFSPAIRAFGWKQMAEQFDSVLFGAEQSKTA